MSNTKKTTSHSRPPRSKAPDDLPHIGSCIKQHLHDKGLSGAWLATRLGCDRTNIYKLFRKQSIDTSLLLRISIIVDNDFFVLFSERLRESIDSFTASQNQQQ